VQAWAVLLDGRHHAQTKRRRGSGSSASGIALTQAGERGVAGVHAGQAVRGPKITASAPHVQPPASSPIATSNDPLQELLDAARERDVRHANMRAQVEADMAARMDTGVRPNHALASALGVPGHTHHPAAPHSGAVPEGGMAGIPDEVECSWCKLPLTACLDQHAHCVCGVLGCSPHSLDDAGLTRFLTQVTFPSLIPGSGLLAEVDVEGDGSCWAYVLLAFMGRLRHASCGHRTDVPPGDRVDDRLLRCAIYYWLREGASASTHARLQRIRDVLPSGGTRFRAGEHGGSEEFAAWSALTGDRVFFVSTEHSQGGEHGSLAVGGVTETTTLREAIKGCLEDGVRLRVARHVGGNHWRAFLPIRQSALPTARGALHAALSDANSRADALLWLADYDRDVDCGHTA
jgi:hypothetical protein